MFDLLRAGLMDPPKTGRVLLLHQCFNPFDKFGRRVTRNICFPEIMNKIYGCDLIQ
jgi:hypothetical protein